MPSPTNAMLNRLLRGITSNHVKTVRTAWRDLLDNQEAATPLVCDKLRTDAWRKEPRGPSGRFLGVLLALLHELDSEKFKEEVQWLRAEPLHPANKAIVEFMARQWNDQVFGTISDQVPVYISGEVDEPELIFSYLQKWSQTRNLAISTVRRVDVIVRRPDMDYRGLYIMLFDGIVITWKNGRVTRRSKWGRKHLTEMTFYHEVGHHFYQHSEGGQIAEQESEARRYQLLMFFKAHPILAIVIGTISLPLVFGKMASQYFKRK